MPSNYSKNYTIPSDFPLLLKAFTREVLRAQPDDIWTFGASYFQELQMQQAEVAEQAGATAQRMSPEELRALLKSLFEQHDADKSGALDMKEFKGVLSDADLKLSDREVKRVLAEADVDGNGTISYEEFLPLGVDLIMALYARSDAEMMKTMEENEARNEAIQYLFHGMTKEEVEKTMREIFAKSDNDSSGALSIAEFQKCCKDADIGLTRKEVNILMHECDVDGDGQITYEEFVPLCFEMLTEILKDEIMAEKRLGDTQLQAFFIDECARVSQGRVDRNTPLPTGKLDAFSLKEVLSNMEVGLNRMQTMSLLAAATFNEVDENGDETLCDYTKFAPMASNMMHRMLDVEAQYERSKYLDSMRTAQSKDMVRGKSIGDITAVLEQEFRAEDASGTGVLPSKVVEKVLMASSLQLKKEDVTALMSACTPVDGGLSYQGSIGSAFYTLQYLDDSAAFASR